MTLPESSTPPLRLALAEDSVLLREGLVRLCQEAGYVVAGAYGDADALLNYLGTCAPEELPDIVLLDVRMPPSFRDEGVRAALEVRRRLPRVGILLLSQYVETVYARELLSGGAERVGYLLKDRIVSLEELKDAILRIHRGGLVLDPEVVGVLLGAHRDPLAALTPREGEVIALMAQGLTNAAIARTLVIGVGAVEKNITAIFGKLGLADGGDEHRRVLAVLTWLQTAAG